jgi:hypothetical protein
MKDFVSLATILLLALLPAPARAQWTEPVRISEPGECWYPQILAHGDTLHVAYSNETGGWKISYVRSTDGGDTWNPHQVLSDTVNTTSTSYARIMKCGGAILVLWRTYFPQQVYWYDIGYRVSVDNGITWGPYGYVLDPNWPGSFYMTASGDDSLINIITSGRTGDSTIYRNIRSTDFGTTWSQPQRLFSIFHSGRTDCSSHEEFVHLAWTGRIDLDHKVEVYYTSSYNGGLDWNPSIPLSDADQFHSQLPSITTDPMGLLALTWMDHKYAPPGFTGDILARASADSGQTWFSENQLTFDHYSFLSDVERRQDSIHVVWENESGGIGHRKIGYIESIDAGGNWSERRWISRPDDDSRNPAVAQADGSVFAIWAIAGPFPDARGIYFSRRPAELVDIKGREIMELPHRITISVYPNPFNSTTTFLYSSAKAGNIKIMDILGQVVNRFQVEASANGRVTWDGADQNCNQVSSGVYFVRFQSESKSKMAKVIYIK